MWNYICKPIVTWPGDLTPSWKQQRSQFDTPWGKTLTLLECEIRALAGKNVILQCAVTEDEIRIDGGIKANARPRHPGVILTFNSKHGPLSYWTDQFDRWSDNVRAIALALEALRKIDRYGVNKAGSQYEGYKRLPPAPANGQRVITRDEAAAFLSEHSGVSPVSLNDPGVLELAFKTARRKLHPDNQETGSDALFVELTEAMAVLQREG